MDKDIRKKAVILVSGGTDSTTCLAIAQSLNFELYAMSFAYGQKHQIEIEKIKINIINYPVCQHQIINLDLSFLTNAALINSNIDVPKGMYHNIDAPKDHNNSTMLPITYVNARNTLFLSYALSFAEHIGASAIFIGIHAQDISYPDCTELFRSSFETLANIGTSYYNSNKKIQILAPLLNLTKAQIIAQGLALNVDYSHTISCYDPQDGRSCGQCAACMMRLDAFRQNNIIDPIEYQ